LFFKSEGNSLRGILKRYWSSLKSGGDLTKTKEGRGPGFKKNFINGPFPFSGNGTTGRKTKILKKQVEVKRGKRRPQPSLYYLPKKLQKGLRGGTQALHFRAGGKNRSSTMAKNSGRKLGCLKNRTARIILARAIFRVPRAGTEGIARKPEPDGEEKSKSLVARMWMRQRGNVPRLQGIN